MEMDRSTTNIGKFDLDRFSVGETKKHHQGNNTIQSHTAIQSRSSSMELIFTYSFVMETLVTNIEIQPNQQDTFNSAFEHVEIQANSLTNRGHYTQTITSKMTREQDKFIYSSLAFTHSLKLSLVLRSDNKKKSARNQRQMHDYGKKVISDSIKDISIFGINGNSNPSPAHLTKLLNISQNFKKYALYHEVVETDILVSLSLINSRRFVQAAELLKRVSNFYIEKYNSNKSSIDMNRSERSWIKDFQEDLLAPSLRNNFTSGRTLEGNKFLHKAAKIQLLRAQTISHPSLIIQKLQAYHKCNSYANGNPSPSSLKPDADLEQIMSMISPQLIPFILKILSDKVEPLRVAALKSIQFILQTLGCSIGAFFVQILQQIVLTYPNNITSEMDSVRIPYGLNNLSIGQSESQSGQQKSQASSIVGKNKMLIDHYHHLLETLITIVVQVNKKIMYNIFTQIIAPNLLSKNLGMELKLYLLRFGEKIITILGADLTIQINFLGFILEVCEYNKNQSFSKKSKPSRPVKHTGRNENLSISNNKQVLYNLVYFGHKILSILKNKVFCKYTGQRVEPVLQWVNKTLNYLCDHELLSSNSSHLQFLFTTILQLIQLIYSNNAKRFDSAKVTHNPIESILYFTNISIHQSGLPFDKILECLRVLVFYLVSINPNCEIGHDIINRIMHKSKSNNLVLKQLKILLKIIEIVQGDEMIQYLEMFLNCIPHSTFDETYEVFHLLLKKSIPQMNKIDNNKSLLTKIMKTMINQYTVKGKAYQQTKEKFIQYIVENSPHLLNQFFSICLYENDEPLPENYYSQTKLKKNSFLKKQVEVSQQNRFDSKMFKIDHEQFFEKITFLQQILAKIQATNSQAIAEIPILVKLCQSLDKLTSSTNWKIKTKVLNIVKQLTDILSFHHGKSKQNCILKYVLLLRCLFGLSKKLLIQQSHRESKIMYHLLYNLMNLYRGFTIQENSLDQDKEEIQKALNEENQFSDYELIVQATENMLFNKSFPEIPQLTFQQSIKALNFIKVKQFLKSWNSLSNLYNSPWQSIKEIFILFILEVFKDGVCAISEPLNKRCVEVIKPLMMSLLTSNDNSERLNGLKIFGCLLGLRSHTKEQILSKKIRENTKYLKVFLEKIFDLQEDWNETNSQISQSICELCFSRQHRENMRKRVMDRKFHNSMIDNSFSTLGLGDEFYFQKKQYSVISNFESLQLEGEDFGEQPQNYQVEITEEILSKIILFKNLIQKDFQNKTENYGDKQSFLEPQQSDQHLYQMGEDRAESIDGKDSKSEDQQLEFQDLGIIQLDDEEWGEEQQKQVRITQKLPLKKIYKLSPNVVGSKPQRIRSKRFHQNQFNYNQNIIVDELEQNIQTDKLKQNDFQERALSQKEVETKRQIKNKFVPIQKEQVQQMIEEDDQVQILSPSLKDTFDFEKTFPKEKKQQVGSSTSINCSQRKSKKSIGKKRKPSNGK